MSNLRFELDRAGFLMIWVEQVQAYIHWLPVTKIEFEIFMCDPSNNKFDDRWYQDILSLNDRVTVKKAGQNDYWKLLLTGVYPTEIEEFSNWLSQDGQYSYSIPTYEEWTNAYLALKGIQAETDLAPYLAKMPERVQSIYLQMNKIMSNSYQKAGWSYTLANQMLMRQGIMEWVQVKDQQWGGMGKPATQLQPSLRDPDNSGPEIPRGPENNRFHHYGFRLLRRY